MDLSSFHSQFRDESSEQVRVLNEGLLAVEQLGGPSDPNWRPRIDAIFRAVHTIKGSARMLGFETVGRLAHAMEHSLGAVRSGARALDRELSDLLLRGGDSLLLLVAAAVEGREPEGDVNTLVVRFNDLVPSEGRPAPPVAPPPPLPPPPPPVATAPLAPPPQAPSTPLPPPVAAPPQPSVAAAGAATAAPPARRTPTRQTVRVRVDRLDRLINLAGELTVSQQTYTTHFQKLQELGVEMHRHAQTLHNLEETLKRLRFSATQRQSIDTLITMLQEQQTRLTSTLQRQSERLGEQLGQQGFLLGDLEQEVMGARLVPIATLFTNMPRAVRDLAQMTSKEVLLDIQGETTELDRKLLETLNDPLVHLIRNAVDHGIESTDERVAAGKPPVGHLWLSAAATGGEVQIQLRDDGRGIDPRRLREIAVQRNFISAEQAALLNDHEALELILLPGFSTARIITDISGRGVGMDVVHTNILELGGQVNIASQLGQGTTITLTLPLTLVTTRILIVYVGTELFALPASGCRATTWVQQAEVRTVEGQATINYEGRTVPLVRLADLLNISLAPIFQSRQRTPAVLVGSVGSVSGGTNLTGLIVEGLFDEREAVVRSLGPLFEQRIRRNPTVLPYNGAVQLGDGRLILVLNPFSLVQATRGRSLTNAAAVTKAPQRAPRLLVADDSFTTRELIRSILSSAGYDLEVAIDGQDALDKLMSEAYDLVVSDVEMPRLDGFQLTTRIRREPALRGLPVVIMTSLASDSHRRQGLEAGAQAYIVKSQFNQDSLLDVIQRLLERS